MTKMTLAVLALTVFVLSPVAHADSVGDSICRLLAAGNTPSTLEHSVVVTQALGPDATRSDKRVFIRSIVAGRCPQYLWRF